MNAQTFACGPTAGRRLRASCPRTLLLATIAISLFFLASPPASADCTPLIPSGNSATDQVSCGASSGYAVLAAILIGLAIVGWIIDRAWEAGKDAFQYAKNRGYNTKSPGFWRNAIQEHEVAIRRQSKWWTRYPDPAHRVREVESEQKRLREAIDELEALTGERYQSRYLDAPATATLFCAACGSRLKGPYCAKCGLRST